MSDLIYYKAVSPDGTSFHDPSFRWVPKAGPVEGIVVIHPNPHDDHPSGWLSAATVPTGCTGMVWDPTSDPPMRLLELTSVNGYPITAPLWNLPNKRAASAWLVVRELPATDALGPQGVEVAAILDRVSRLTDGETRKLTAAREAAAAHAAWFAAWFVAKDAAQNAARIAAWNAVRKAVWNTSLSTVRTTAWDAAWDAAMDAARATLTRDLITPEQYDTLMTPWREVITDV